MNQPENPVIYVFKALLAYVSPISRFKNFDTKFDNKTSNLSKKTKNTLSKVYLTFFLCSSFSFIWLSYYDLKLALEGLSTFRHPDCGIVEGACSDTWLSGYVKLNDFKISTILEVLFLVVGVVVGNIGWDQTAKVKESGFEIAHEFFNVILIIALATLSISFICIDLVDFIQGKNDYRDLSLKKLLYCLIILALLFGVETYYARKKFNKKINADE